MIRRISVRQFQRNFSQEVADLPFIVVKKSHPHDEGIPVCVVDEYKEKTSSLIDTLLK